MRWVKTTVVFLMLIALPALSWYYLRQGANWRITGLEAMANKEAIELPNGGLSSNGEAIVLPESGFIIASNLSYDNPGTDKVLDKLAEQFNHRSDLTYLYFGEENSQLAEEWQTVDCNATDCQTLARQLFRGDQNAAFIDDSLYLRSTYDLTEESEVLKLVEHAAILMPVERRPKIELKRGETD